MARAIVVKTDKHTQEFKLLSFTAAVDDLASIMPASIYNSRMEIAFDLARRPIETLGYMYEFTVAVDPRDTVEHNPANQGQAPDVEPLVG